MRLRSFNFRWLKFSPSSENVLVGTREWGGSYTDVPAMGYDEDLNTAGYCNTGDIVRFKLFRPSTGEMFDLVGEDISLWEDNLIDIVTSMSIHYGDFSNDLQHDVQGNFAQAAAPLQAKSKSQPDLVEL